MRPTMAVMGLVFVLSVSAFTQGPDNHVRPLDPWASESLDRGLKGTAIVGELVRSLNALDVIVHVETSTGIPWGIAGMTRLVSDAGQRVYIRVTLDRGLMPDYRAATLAHELRHAVELAQNGTRTQAEMLRLYMRIGYKLRGQRPFFETIEAQRAGSRALAELAKGAVFDFPSSRPQQEP